MNVPCAAQPERPRELIYYQGSWKSSEADWIVRRSGLVAPGCIGALPGTGIRDQARKSTLDVFLTELMESTYSAV